MFSGQMLMKIWLERVDGERAINQRELAVIVSEEEEEEEEQK